MDKSPIAISLLNYGICTHGDVVADHGISCGGLIEGNMTVTQGLLHVAAGAIIRGRAEGEHVLIEGTVEGGVAARASLEINGRVKGDIIYVTRAAFPTAVPLATDTSTDPITTRPETGDQDA
ncbi:bactofilin family protein [Cupriavidus pinatubonensis]|uniref:bactofilin family protein n=1 Tax=Cupriavidus pinatubonensis TaxID=248026 RepID=UPI00112C3ACA|nr:polymer-forming cytoskeletal protein [Cupriavidus pinatubonensis]TPQ30622.1 hypothetical protein C2U69_30620 [Cupriavidus pinatubonensis]